jgi:hypothetical protein
MASSNETIRDLEKLARKIASELDEAKRAADRVASLSTDLHVIRRAIALAGGQQTILPDTNQVSEQDLNQNVVALRADSNGARPMTELVLEMLRKNPRPMKVKEIMRQLRETNPDAKEMTIVSHLVRFRQKGLVKRTEPGTYQIARTPVT